MGSGPDLTFAIRDQIPSGVSESTDGYRHNAVTFDILTDLTEPNY